MPLACKRKLLQYAMTGDTLMQVGEDLPLPAGLSLVTDFLEVLKTGHFVILLLLSLF